MRVHIPPGMKRDYVYKPGNPTRGVQLKEDGLLWYSAGFPAYASGGASKQSFEDFILNGPFDKKILSYELSALVDAVEQLTNQTIAWAHLDDPT